MVRKKRTKSTPQATEVVVNLTPLMTPIAILLGSILIAFSFWLGIRDSVYNANNAVTSLNCTSTSPLSRDCLGTYASDLKLDVSKFLSCVDNGDTKQTITDEIASGDTLGVQGTPTFFLGKGKADSFKGFSLGAGMTYADLSKMLDYSAGNTIEDSQRYWTNFQLDQLNSFRSQVVDYYSGSQGGSLKGDALNKQVDSYMAQQKQLIEQESAIKDLTVGKGIIEGSGEVTLMEFSDFECPYCLQFSTTVFGDVKKNYIDNNKIRFIFRDYPLQTIHPDAFLAAQAARCAAIQDKYLEYHDKLYASQNTVSTQ